MSGPADFSEQGEVFRKSMVDALAKLDTIADQAHKAHEQATEMQAEAQEELNRIEREAHKIAEAFVEERRTEIEDRLREEILFGITKTMIIDGRSAKEIYKWLKIPEKMMADAWMELGFSPLGNHVATVRYINDGKSGEVIFYREDIVIRFPYEFIGGETIATIGVISDEKWKEQTGLPHEDRFTILEFIAQRVIRDHAEGHNYIVGNDSIIIMP